MFKGVKDNAQGSPFRREIIDRRIESELGVKLEAESALDQLKNRALRIAEISEMAPPGGAGRDTGRVLSLSNQVGAEGAL